MSLTRQPALDAAEFHAVELPEVRHELLEIHLVVEEAAVEGVGEVGRDDDARCRRRREAERVRRCQAEAARLPGAVQIDVRERRHPADGFQKAAERPHDRERRGRAVAGRESLAGDRVVVGIGVEECAELPLQLQKEPHEALQAGRAEPGEAGSSTMSGRCRPLRTRRADIPSARRAPRGRTRARRRASRSRASCGATRRARPRPAAKAAWS